MAHCDGAMVQIDARINSLEGTIGGIALLIASYHIVAHPQWDNLLVMEGVLDDDDATTALFVGLLIGIVFFLTVVEFAHTYTDAEFLSAFGTFEDQ